MLLFTLGLLVLFVAILMPLAPQLLYDERYNQLDLNKEHHIFTEPTTLLVTGASTALGLAVVQGLIHQHQQTSSQKDPKEAPLLTIIMGCDDDKDATEDARAKFAEQCHQARAQIWHDITGTREHATVVAIPLDLGHKESIEHFSVQLQAMMPKTSEAFVSPLHLVIYASEAATIHAAQQQQQQQQQQHQQQQYVPKVANPEAVESHVRRNYLGHALLTHHIWKNILAVNEQDARRKARLVVASSGWTLLPIDPLRHWYSEHETLTKNDRSSLLEPVFRTISSLTNYVRSKRAQLYFLAKLQDQNPQSITTGACHGGANSILTTVFHEQTGYVGPKWFVWGEPVVISRASTSLHQGSAHHRGFEMLDANTLFEKTIDVLKIAKFGKKSYVIM